MRFRSWPYAFWWTWTWTPAMGWAFAPVPNFTVPLMETPSGTESGVTERTPSDSVAVENLLQSYLS